MAENELATALVVEDDPGMRDYYRRLFKRLETDGYFALVVKDAESALAVLRRESVDLMVLDWGLPGISGETLLRAMRAHPRTRSIGVLMVTGKSTAAEEIQALDSGADDHLAKPFEESVLVARINNLRRRKARAPKRTLSVSYPGFSFDASTDSVVVSGRVVRLSPRELDLLALLLSRPDTPYPYARLWESLWGGEPVYRGELLGAAVAALKRKLGPEWGARVTRHEEGGYLFKSPP